MPITETELARAIGARTWAQFQLAGAFPDSAELLLMLIGSVTKVEIQNGSFKCRSDDPLRARGGGWEQARQPADTRRRASQREQADRDVSVRFPADQVVFMQQSSFGRLLLMVSNPREDMVLVLFPQDDSGDTEMFQGLTIKPIDLVRAQATTT